MTTTPTPAAQRGRKPRPIRWIALLIASVLLHVAAFNWAEGRIGLPSWHTQEQQVITTELHSQPVPVLPAPTPVAAAPKPKLKPKARPRQRAAPPPPVLPPAADAAPTLASTAPEKAAADTEAATGAAGADDASAKNDVEPTVQDNTPPEPATKRYKFNRPPSAELSYDVEVLAKGQKWHVSGTYRWEASDAGYTAAVEVGTTIIVRITALDIKSEGTIGEYGLEPVLYSEKPMRRSLMHTHFQHDNRKISFSASEAVYPYNGGEQDRASIIWQLAGIGRGDPAQFAPGASLDIVVAGTRDAENWHFDVNGLEEVDTGDGKTSAWHVKQVRNPGSYDRTLDIWLAPQHEWYPVKVRYTEANGDIYDLSLTKIAPITAQ